MKSSCVTKCREKSSANRADYHRRDYPGPSQKKSVTQRDLTHIPEAEGNRVNAVALISGAASRLPSRAPSRHLPPNITIPVTNRSFVHPTIITIPDYTLSKLDLAHRPHISRDYIILTDFQIKIQVSNLWNIYDKNRKDAKSSLKDERQIRLTEKKLKFRVSGDLSRMRSGDFNAWLTRRLETNASFWFTVLRERMITLRHGGEFWSRQLSSTTG